MTIKLTFLGTGAQIPSAKRNHSGILLTYKGENILVDCGEGMQRQFRKAKLNPCKVTRILITHWHGDHVLGIPGLLQTLAHSGYKKELFIYGPDGTEFFMKKMLDLFRFKRDFKITVKDVSKKVYEAPDFYIEATPMKHGIPSNAYNFVKKGLIRIDKVKLKKSKLPHGPLLSKLKQGKDITYKGKKYKAKDLTFTDGNLKVSFVMDTLMNPQAAKFVKDADLLVCESSFDSSLAAKAKEHMHLTSEQAATVAKDGNVKKLYLTHISQRYENNLEKLENQAKKIFKNTHLAEDLHSITI